MNNYVVIMSGYAGNACRCNLWFLLEEITLGGFHERRDGKDGVRLMRRKGGGMLDGILGDWD